MNKTKNTKSNRSLNLLCIRDIYADNKEEYQKIIENLPLIQGEFSIIKNKKKIENAGFMFYVKYEIPTLIKQKGIEHLSELEHIEEIFLYKDKIDTFKELERQGHIQLSKGKEQGKKNSNNNENEDENDRDNKKEKTFKKGTNLVKKYVDSNIDIYDILGVEESDSIETIKTAYKQLILIFHPDKSKSAYSLVNENTKKKNKKNKKKTEGDKHDISYYIDKYKINVLTEEEKNAMFLKIQDAYTILSDKVLRKQYDSSIPFNESIPTSRDLENGKDFYHIFKPVFKRNAKWSVYKPVPDLGDDETDYKDVKNFYDFWFGFESWRDFSCQNEYNYDEAECREERRWMERENKKIQRKAQKAENLRIMKLVELAFQNDPRVKREKERVKMEKQKKQEMKMLEKQKQIEEEEEAKNKANENKIENTTKEKVVIKLWKHHIKSLCHIKLANKINYSVIEQGLMKFPFITLCDLIYEIYSLLNFNFINGDKSAKKKNQHQTGMKETQNINYSKESLSSINKNGNTKSNKLSNGNASNKTDKTNQSKKNATNKENNGKSSINSNEQPKLNNQVNQNTNQKSETKSTGFLDHLKNMELTEKQEESILEVFKKYMGNVDFSKESIPNNVDMKAEKSNGSEKEEATSVDTTAATSGRTSSVHIMDSNSVHTEYAKSSIGKSTIEDQESTVVENNVESKKEEEVEEEEKKKKEETNTKNDVWTALEISQLANALKLYPGGTKDRWVLIANSLKTKTVKEVIKKTKEMFENDTLKNLGSKIQESAFDHFKVANKGVMKKIEDQLDKREVPMDLRPSDNQNIQNLNEKGKTSAKEEEEESGTMKPWNEQEQELLEKALAKYSSSIPFKDRLKLITEDIPTRSNDEIVLRLKQIKAKILAQKAMKLGN